MTAYQEYPMWLHHPSARAAVVSDAYANGPPPIGYQPPPGKPAQLPPVLVNDQNQEEYYLAKGYQRGKVTPRAVEEVRVAPTPSGYEHRDWPRMVDGRLEHDPSQPVEKPGEYPKYVRIAGLEKLVTNRAEEDEFREAHRAPPPPKSEAEQEFWAAVQAAETASAPSEGDLEELRAQAVALGIEVDGRWRESRLRQEIEAARQEVPGG